MLRLLSLKLLVSFETLHDVREREDVVLLIFTLIGKKVKDPGTPNVSGTTRVFLLNLRCTGEPTSIIRSPYLNTDIILK